MSVRLDFITAASWPLATTPLEPLIALAILDTLEMGLLAPEMVCKKREGDDEERGKRRAGGEEVLLLFSSFLFFTLFHLQGLTSA